MASLEALAGHEHIQEIILQNFVPHRKLLRRGAGRDRHRGRRALLGHRPLRRAAPRPAEVGLPGLDRRHEAARGQETRRLMPEVGIQIPPNLADWWPELVQQGATDLGGLSSNGDHISPEHPFPSPKQVRERLQGIAAVSERLCVYPQYMNDEWIAPRVLDVIEDQLPLASCRAGAPRPRPATRSSAPATASADPAGARGDVRREPARGDRGHAPGRRRAARRSWRATS